MRVLGIESSCDETAVALLRGEGESLVVEQSLVASQAELHAAYGGVVPEVAARRHVDVIFPLLSKLGIARDGVGIDAVAATAGPGLAPALRIGLEAGKALAWVWQKPFVAANHMEGHVYSAWLSVEPPKLPALCLLVSGGHTQLVLMKGHGDYEMLGETRDDAAGEAFDKVAKLLGLSYPGGPEIARLAAQGNPEAVPFPRPMLESGDLDFSFSGLKTAVRVYLKEHPGARKEDVAASFQAAVVDALVGKALKAAEAHAPASVILAGGVSANEVLGEKLSKALGDLPLRVSAREYSGDNAAMIAAAGYFRAREGKTDDPLASEANPNMRLA